MASLRDAFPDLEALFAGLPDRPCTACGLCCVTPHMTIVEFAYLMDGLLREWPREALLRLVSTPMEPERRFPGNYKCLVQEEKGLCGLHPRRPLICRLEGLSLLDRMLDRQVRNCPYGPDESADSAVRPEDVDGWVQRAFDLSGRFYPVYEEPYWMNSLNFQSWLAVALDETIAPPFVLGLHDLLRECLEMDFLEDAYEDTTGLAEKLDLIDEFFRQAEAKQPRRALRAVRAAIHRFPRTGSYFEAEGKRYFDLMRTIVRQREGS